MSKEKYLHIDDLKRIELSILKYIDITLREAGIVYFLDGGTLLGAVRHKGFIPWDDDIDIIIRRCDYRRAIDVLNQGSERYKVLSSYDRADYFYPFAKVVDTNTVLIEKHEFPVKDLGIWVDIFPLDYLPDSDVERAHFQDTVWRYRQIMTRCFAWLKGNRSGSLKWKLSCLYSRVYGWKRALKKINALCESTANLETSYACDIVAARKRRLEPPSNCFSSVDYLEFEGSLFPVPVGYDTYLRALYGDYMQLPPKEQQVTNHEYTAYMKHTK